MKVERFIFGPFQTNTYVVSDENGQALIIDPACTNLYEQQTLLRYIQCENLQVQQIIATHGHMDHLWGAKWATQEWSLPVLIHEADIPIAKAMQEQYDLFGIRAKAEEFPVERIQNTDRFTDRIQTELQIIHTPGHTPGSVCLYWEKEKVLLSGDTLFHMGFGRTDLPGGNVNQLFDSLQELFTLPADVRVYPGHADFTTIGAERRR
jgi:glyoxylase-like metal-dependent hydrolase (beta-lactamase superfamily II)